MMWVGENLMSYGRFIQPDEVIRKIEAVSEKDIHRVAGEVLNGKSLSVAMITPGGNDKHAELIRSKMSALD
jgi:predicted Zn-dependent peptidase